MSAELIEIGILIFDDVEELDFVGPWEVWNMVNIVTRYHDEADRTENKLKPLKACAS